jgi:hypothetical protein
MAAKLKGTSSTPLMRGHDARELGMIAQLRHVSSDGSYNTLRCEMRWRHGHARSDAGA